MRRYFKLFLKLARKVMGSVVACAHTHVLIPCSYVSPVLSPGLLAPPKTSFLLSCHVDSFSPLFSHVAATAPPSCPAATNASPPYFFYSHRSMWGVKKYLRINLLGYIQCSRFPYGIFIHVCLGTKVPRKKSWPLP